MRNLAQPIDRPHLINRSYVWTQPTVHAQHLPIDHARQPQVIEHVRAPPPRVRASVLPLTLIVEPVHLRDLSALVISSQQRHVRGPARFQQHQQRERLQTVVSAIDEVAHENVIRPRHLSAGLEQFHQVVKLSVNVTAHRHRAVHALDVGFLDEELFDAGAEISQFVLFERLAAADLGEPGVEVERGHRA